MSVSLAGGLASCGPPSAAHSAFTVAQLVGELLIPAVAIWLIAAISRRHPTTTPRWSRHGAGRLLDKRSVMVLAAFIHAAGLLAYGASVVLGSRGGPGCGRDLGALGALGLLLTLSGAMLLAVCWAVAKQAGWVVLASLFALDVWMVVGMVMMHLRGVPDAPDPMLLLAFVMHAVCMCLTTVWAFRARDLDTLDQIRAAEAGRSIGAVWVFLAAYIVVSFFHDEAGPFDSVAGGAVLSALTLSALALTMGSGYTKYLEIMARRDHGPARAGKPGSAGDPVGAAVDVHRLAAQEGDQRQPGLGGQVHSQ